MHIVRRANKGELIFDVEKAHLLQSEFNTLSSVNKRGTYRLEPDVYESVMTERILNACACGLPARSS